MRLVNKIALSLVAASTLILAGCNNDAKPAMQEVVKPTISEESLGLRKVDLYNEKTVTPDETIYSKKMAGSSHTIKRAFQDAPPMIPHEVTGMLPITISDNQCATCHVDSAPYDTSIPSVPISHLTDFRPLTTVAKNGQLVKNGQTIDNTSTANMDYVTVKKGKTLVGARFSCTQCHAPQSQGKLVVESTFEAVYSDKDGATKSSWKGSRLTDALDTLKD